MAIRYRTLQHIKMGPEPIEPFTEVVVLEEDRPIWDELVKYKAAELVEEVKEAEPEPKPEEVKPVDKPRGRRKPD